MGSQVQTDNVLMIAKHKIGLFREARQSPGMPFYQPFYQL
jgi:hypothetical protein